MSKKRIYRRKRRCKSRSMSALDNHHIFYQRRHYKRGSLFELRNYHYCIIPIPKNTLHMEIHEYLGDIPTPSEINAKAALEQLYLLEDYHAISASDSLEKRLMVLIALFECGEQLTADALKRQLDIVCEFKASSK